MIETTEKPIAERKKEETGVLTAAEAVLDDAHDQIQTEAFRTEYTDSTGKRAELYNKYEMSRTDKALEKVRKFLGLPLNEKTEVTVAHDDAIAEKPFQDEQLRIKREKQEERERRNAA